MNSIPCDIVLLPTDNIADKAYSLSKQFENNDTYYTLKNGEYYPHISLYMTQLKLSAMSHVSDLLSAIAARTSIIELTAKEYHQLVGYIDVEYERTTPVDNLQMTVINEINPLRDGLRLKDQARLETVKGIERENLELYGYRSVGDLFAPHITFTRFKDGASIDTSLDLFPHSPCNPCHATVFPGKETPTCNKNMPSMTNWVHLNQLSSSV